jgi:uncharacterized protein YndB with AHSA1/START domain
VAATLANDELSIARTFDAPRELVFELWSNPAHLQRWMGPEGFECPVAEVDFRVGGRYRGLIRSKEHGDNWFGGVYREIEPHERLVFTFTWNNTGPSAGRAMLVTITFEEAAGRTLMTFHQAPFADVGARDRHVEGWTSAFGKIAAYLQKLKKEATR